MRNKILIFDFLPNSLSDAVNVCQCSGFQSITFVWYCWGYNCESIVVWSLASMRDQILISYFLSNLLSDEQNVQQHSCLQSTTSFQYYFGYRCESILEVWLQKYETRFWFPISYPTYPQMYAMFFDAEAFNQPLYFDTAKVKTVRVYLYGVMQ